MKQVTDDKYTIITLPNSVIAISTYAGKTVKGIAKVDPRDTFDPEVGKKLAIARCANKIAKKREQRALRKIAFAQAQLDSARKYYEKMSNYLDDARNDAFDASKKVQEIEQSVK